MEEVQIPMGEKNGKYRRIGLKIGCVAALMQVVSVVLAMTICVFMFNSLVTRMQEERCTNGTSVLAHELERLSGDEDPNQVLDNLKSRMNCEFTIFEGDTRAYSTVTQNGQRAVGTKLSSDLIPIVLQQGQSYVGEATILGERYLCSYVPTKGSDGQVTGLIFAGISTADATKESARVITLAIVASIAAIIVCAGFLAAYLKKSISDPLGEITQVARRLERGDLGLTTGEDVHISIRSNDEIGVLGQIFKDTIQRLRSYIGEIDDVLGSIASSNLTQSAAQDYMGDFQSIKKSLDSIQAALNTTMGQITTSAGQVSAGSEQVSSSAQALAQGAAEQASSIQEISTTIAEISVSAQQTSSAAAEAGGFVNQVGSQLGLSMECVKELNVAMENISRTSKKISTIISTIENIAFQTNILALNAAVEAARAGSAGKGFAVVADEVSNLASKSDEATQATKELIESAITAVTEGSHAVSKVTESLEQTNQIAGSVTSKMAIVVDAVEKQTAAISQITDGIDHISSVVQNNSATSEECAAASEEMSTQAGLLKNLMGSFKLRNMN